MPFPRTIVKINNSVLRMQYLGRCHSSKASGGQKLSPLPSSPTQAKKQYLKSKEATDRYLDPQQKIVQMNRELEIIRDKHATKLEKELEKSIYRRLVDPLVMHKHSLYNVMAMTIAYILAHNLYVTSKKEKECRADLMQTLEENAKLKQKMDESTLRDFSIACAAEIEREFDKKRSPSALSVLLSGLFASTKTSEENLLGDIIANVLQKQLLDRLGKDNAIEECDKPSTEEIMLQNQEKIKAMNANTELLIQDAVHQSSSDQKSGKQSRRVFSL